MKGGLIIVVISVNDIKLLNDLNIIKCFSYMYNDLIYKCYKLLY